MYADTENKDQYSQHTNSLAILAGQIKSQAAQVLASKLLTDTSLAPASIYFKYYLHQALIKAGLGNNYLNWLGKWKENIEMGLTTWGESSDINSTRSDCHAWGASPNIEFYRTLLGIDSDAPGYRKIKIEPHPGSLIKLSGSIQHPNGTIKVKYLKAGEKWSFEISIPEQTEGYLIWNGKKYLLKNGINKVQL